MLADVLTKPLNRDDHEYFSAAISGRPIPRQIRQDNASLDDDEDDKAEE
jgi:hypothetical protein